MGRTLGRTAALVALGRALTSARRGGPGVGARLAALPRLVWASLRRRYDGLWRVGLMALAFLYVVWPLDLMPVFMLGPVGLIDDAVVLTWLAGAVISETSRFLEWEQRIKAIPAQSGPTGSAAGVDSAEAPAPHGDLNQR